MPSGYAHSLATTSKGLIFLGTDTSTGIWKSDGTGAGTIKITSKVQGFRGISDVTTFVETSNAIFFTGRAAGSGTELWRTDGTEVGTTLVKDVEPGAEDGNPLYMQPIGGKVFFAGFTNASRGSHSHRRPRGSYF